MTRSRASSIKHPKHLLCWCSVPPPVRIDYNPSGHHPPPTHTHTLTKVLLPHKEVVLVLPLLGLHPPLGHRPISVASHKPEATAVPTHAGKGAQALRGGEGVGQSHTHTQSR